MKISKVLIVFFALAFVIGGIGLSGAIPTYSSTQFLYRYVVYFVSLGIIVLAFVLPQYRKLVQGENDNKKVRNMNIFTMLLVLVAFVGISVNLNNEIKKDGIYPSLQTCDYFDQYQNKILGGNVEGTCPEITVLTNTDSTMEISFTEEFEGSIYTTNDFNVEGGLEDALYERFGLVTIEYEGENIVQYEIQQTVLVSFYYGDITRYSYESGLYSVSNEYSDSFKSTRTQYYIHEFLNELPAYDIHDYYDYTLLGKDESVLEVNDGILYVDEIIYAVEHDPVITENSAITSGQFITKTYTDFDSFKLLEKWESTIFNTVKEYESYNNPFTDNIHVEEDDFINGDLVIIKPISIGYCVENRINYGYETNKNEFLLNTKVNIEYGYLKYESFLETHGIFAGEVLFYNNPILDYINYN